MNEDRLLVCQAVYEGQIGSEHLTLEEVDELALTIVDAVLEQCLDDAVQRGCMVFDGVEGDILLN
jgi:formylmethanofuran dehydrogenase subunit E